MTVGPRNCKRLLGAKSHFSQQNLQRDVLDRDEETARIQLLTILFLTSICVVSYFELSAEGRKSHKQSSDKVAKDTQL
ncbi:hypothetical protein HN51_024413 [Arachis hypogaea]